MPENHSFAPELVPTILRIRSLDMLRPLDISLKNTPFFSIQSPVRKTCDHTTAGVLASALHPFSDNHEIFCMKLKNKTGMQRSGKA